MGRNKTPEHRAQIKRWALEHPERIKELSRASEQRNYAARQQYKREYYQINKDKIRIDTRRNKLKRKYGITQLEYDTMLSAQGGVCAIKSCPTPDTTDGSFRVDHCHVTGKVRGLLCHKCNSGIGLLGDTLEALELAVAYLRRFHEQS